MMDAAMGGFPEVVAFLLDQGAEVEARDDEGRTALMWAVMMGRTRVVELLKRRGADVNAVDHRGCSALMRAALFGHENTARVPVKGGANTALHLKGMTALDFARCHGQRYPPSHSRSFNTKGGNFKGVEDAILGRDGGRSTTDYPEVRDQGCEPMMMMTTAPGRAGGEDGGSSARTKTKTKTKTTRRGADPVARRRTTPHVESSVGGKSKRGEGASSAVARPRTTTAGIDLSAGTEGWEEAMEIAPFGSTPGIDLSGGGKSRRGEGTSAAANPRATPDVKYPAGDKSKRGEGLSSAVAPPRTTPGVESSLGGKSRRGEETSAAAPPGIIPHVESSAGGKSKRVEDSSAAPTPRTTPGVKSPAGDKSRRVEGARAAARPPATPALVVRGWGWALELWVYLECDLLSEGP
jgi:hypothetical protein